MADGARFVRVDRHTEPGLYWPIKRAFVTYVLRIADGQVMGSPGVTVVDSGTFVFALVEGAPDEPTVGPVSFRGELRLQAHNGALGVRIANPRIELGAEGPEVRARILIDDPEGSTRAVPLVTFAAERDGARWIGTDVRLTAEAVPLFGGYYGEGEVFDDLVMVTAGR